MKNFFKIGLGILLCACFTIPVMADDLTVNIGIKSGEKTTEIVGANIYAKVDNNLTQILIRPDDQAFFMNLKAGSLRIGSFWMTNAKTKKITSDEK